MALSRDYIKFGMFQPNSIKGLLMRKEERMMDTMGSDQKMPSDKSIYDRDI